MSMADTTNIVVAAKLATRDALDGGSVVEDFVDVDTRRFGVGETVAASGVGVSCVPNNPGVLTSTVGAADGSSEGHSSSHGL